MKNRTKWPSVYLAVLMALMYLPILLVIIYSFNESKITSVWGGFSLRWYTELFRDRTMFEALLNSLLVGVVSCFLAALIGTFGAVGMSKVSFRSKGVIEYASQLPMMIPEIVLGMVFLTYFSLLRLPFGMITLIIAHTAFCIPYVYMEVKARLVGLDPSYVEAAKDLGASEIRAFFDIIFPLMLPAVASGVLLAFAMSFDDVIISVFVTGVDVNTLPIKVYSQVKTGVTPKINALCTLMFAITVIVIVIFNIIRRKNDVKTLENKDL